MAETTIDLSCMPCCETLPECGEVVCNFCELNGEFPGIRKACNEYEVTVSGFTANCAAANGTFIVTYVAASNCIWKYTVGGVDRVRIDMNDSVSGVRRLKLTLDFDKTDTTHVTSVFSYFADNDTYFPGGTTTFLPCCSFEFSQTYPDNVSCETSTKVISIRSLCEL